MPVDKKLKRKFSVFTVFFTFFMDNLGFTIVFPILTPLFLNPSESLLSSDFSYQFKAMLLGLFLGVYPLAQFIFAPIIGELSDKHGRKKTLVVTAFVTCIGYFLCALSIHYRWIIVFFISRFVLGASSGNLSVCLSSLSDLSSCKKEKIRFYGLGSVIAGVTFILGPFIGGKFSDSSICKLFSPSFPFVIGGFLTIINLLFLLFAFIETIQEKSKERFDLNKGVHNIQMVLQTPSVKKLYLIYFFYLLSWNMLFQFIPAFLVTKYASSNSTIGDISAIMGVAWILGSMLLYKFLLPFFKTKSLLLVTAFLLAMGMFSCAFFSRESLFILFLGLSVFIASFAWPLCAGAISNAAHSKMQGKILGLSQSVQSFAMMLAPLIVGPFLSKESGMPFYISACVSAIFGILVLLTKIPEYHSHDTP